MTHSAEQFLPTEHPAHRCNSFRVCVCEKQFCAQKFSVSKNCCLQTPVLVSLCEKMYAKTKTCCFKTLVCVCVCVFVCTFRNLRNQCVCLLVCTHLCVCVCTRVGRQRCSHPIAISRSCGIAKDENNSLQRPIALSTK